jgi:D-aminoacyl-tRNA deacylase
VGRIDGPGLLVLLGVHRSDGDTQIAALSRKIAGLRILRGEVSAVDAAAPVLLVSQFTLYADTGKGRRPSWSAAAPAEVAEPIVTKFAEQLRELGLEVETGRFGAEMAVESVNDGPVTLLLEV